MDEEILKFITNKEELEYWKEALKYIEANKKKDLLTKLKFLEELENKHQKQIDENTNDKTKQQIYNEIFN